MNSRVVRLMGLLGLIEDDPPLSRGLRHALGIYVLRFVALLINAVVVFAFIVLLVLISTWGRR
jgi:hypothetical protein